MKRGSGVVIAGGGTAGHVVPGLAIAHALVTRGLPADQIHWIGSSRGMEVIEVPDAGFALTVLPGRGLERRFTLANLRNGFDIVRALPRAFGVVRRLRPGAVVCLGGYAAVPASVSAVLLGVPIVIQEQNAKPSLANRLVSRFAKASAVLTQGTGLKHEVVTGNPLHQDVRAAVLLDSAEAKRLLEVPEGRTLILAFGGSLGSLRINLAILGLAEQWRHRDDIAIRHVTGRRDWDELQPRIRALAATALHYRAVEFEHDMATSLAATDVAVCRAGGMTVSELSALGVPAILIPLPIAPNDAQRHNAKALASAGAAVVVSDDRLDATRLEQELIPFIGEDLAVRGAAARSVGRPEAADAVAALVEDAIRG